MSNDPANSKETASVPAESADSSEPVEKGDEYPLEAPSTDAPVEEGNAEAARSGRESFSSEPNDEASGA